MALTTGIEAAASPSYSAITLQADSLPGTSNGPSLESREPHRPVIISMRNLGVEEAPISAQSEPSTVTKAYSLKITKLNIKFAAICLGLFLEGWNLGATGPLIPAIQKHYGVSSQFSASWILTINLGAGKL